MKYAYANGRKFVEDATGDVFADDSITVLEDKNGKTEEVVLDANAPTPVIYGQESYVVSILTLEGEEPIEERYYVKTKEMKKNVKGAIKHEKNPKSMKNDFDSKFLGKSTKYK